MADKKLGKKFLEDILFYYTARHRFISVFRVCTMVHVFFSWQIKGKDICTFDNSDSALLFDNLYINTGKSRG